MIERYKILQCRNKIGRLASSRKQEISSIARRWTFSGGANGSGGIGRASTEADIWSDIERNKLAVWKNNEMKRCNSANTGSNSSFQTMPPPYSEIAKPSNTPNSSAPSNNGPMEIDNSCIQDGGTQMCYDRQSQRYGNN